MSHSNSRFENKEDEKVNQFSTRELLALEDLSKLYESIDKNIQHALSEISDNQITGMLTRMSQEHRQWIQQTGSIIRGSMM